MGKVGSISEGIHNSNNLTRVPTTPVMRTSLRHELLDEILSYLSLDDKQNRQSLQNHSLVAKSWTNASRRYLFKTVEIQETTLQSWLDIILPANNELLHYVRSLSYITATAPWRNGWQSEHHIDVLRDYLPSFHRLQHLSLSAVHIPLDISRQVEMFSAFRHTFSRLSLEHCKVTIGTLATLINCFSNLNRLDLNHLLHEVDSEPTSPPRPLIRKLHLSGFRRDDLGIFYQLSELGPVPNELVVDCRLRLPEHILSSITDSGGICQMYKAVATF